MTVLGTVLVGTQVQIEEGPHSVRHVSPVAKFSGYLYGMADKESYSFQIGTRMALINQVSSTVFKKANTTQAVVLL